MSTLRLQQLLALKEELGPPELQAHERFSAQQAQQLAARAQSSSSSSLASPGQPVAALQQQQVHAMFPFGQELLQSPDRWRLDPRSQDARMQELLAVLHQFVRPGTSAPAAELTLMTIRTTLFDVLVNKVWGARVFESRGVNGLDVLNDQALDLLLECFCKVVHTYKKQQLLLNYGGNESVFRVQQGDQAVRQWCTVVFGGTDTAAIKQGMFGWEQKLVDMLEKLFSWRAEQGSGGAEGGGAGAGGARKTVHAGRSVLHFGAHPVPQARVFRALQYSRVFRRIFRAKTTPDYPHPLLLVAEDNQGPGGAVQGLELEVRSLVRVVHWDEKHACAHVQQLGWRPTERDLVLPLDKCPNAKRDNVVPGAVLEVGKLLWKEGEVPGCNGLVDRWVPVSQAKLVHKAHPHKQKQKHDGGGRGQQGGGGGGGKKGKGGGNSQGRGNQQHGGRGGGGGGGNNQQHQKGVCHAWAKNKHCKYGNKCHFQHTK